MRVGINSKVQDDYLAAVKSKKIEMTIYLMNGFQMKGKIIGFDDISIVVETDRKQQLVYKHAVSTVVPIVPVPVLQMETKNTGIQGE